MCPPSGGTNLADVDAHPRTVCIWRRSGYLRRGESWAATRVYTVGFIRRRRRRGTGLEQARKLTIRHRWHAGIIATLISGGDDLHRRVLARTRRHDARAHADRDFRAHASRGRDHPPADDTAPTDDETPTPPTETTPPASRNRHPSRPRPPLRPTMSMVRRRPHPDRDRLREGEEVQGACGRRRADGPALPAPPPPSSP